MLGDCLSERMARMARHLQESHADAQATLQSAVEVAQSEVNGCEAAAISFLRGKGPIRTVAFTHTTAQVADALQYELGEGPCIDAAWVKHVVRSQDLAHEPRWPAWGPRVVQETGVQSILCFQLFTNEHSLGALSLYAKSMVAFDDTDVEEGFAIAAHISIAVAASQEADSLTQGLASRTVIGQATGILMERFDLDAAKAFSILSRMSSQGNTKIRHLAEEIVDKRHDSRITVRGDGQ
jgi:transcriptional regulator with GAF, ATPase, and Fis domain